MSARIPAKLAREVRERAGNVCEYCRLPQFSQEATFHIDHVTPRSARGATTLSNLALACVSCSLRKAARLHGRDPETGNRVTLFNPREHTWREHFDVVDRLRIEGHTPIGRATVIALAMNREVVVAMRQELANLGRFSREV